MRDLFEKICREIQRWLRAEQSRWDRCTKNCHMPVERLHTLERQADKFALFSLTIKIKGVQT